MTFEVIVGNVGSVYRGASRIQANRKFREYVEQSRSFVGRAGGETVSLLADDVLVEDYYQGLGLKDGPQR